jgi:transposase
MIKTTGSRRDAASTLFNLPGFRVVDAVDDDAGGRGVLVESLVPPGCPTCGVVATRVHSRREQVVRDVPVAGPVRVVWAKRRWFCQEDACGRRTFWERTVQVPVRARSTLRLKDALVAAVVGSGRSARETGAAHGVSWWSVQRAISAVAVMAPPVEDLVVRRLGIDEHRYRSVRWFRDQTGGWRRFEPWMTTFVDLDTGAVLGVVDGRDSTGVGGWLEARSTAWRERVEVVAIDPSAAFCKAVTANLPGAAVSVDAFHLVQLANQMLTAVRQRRAREVHDRRGRACDPAWANRRLLLRAANTLSARAWDRLEHVFAVDDPTGQLEWAWAVKEHVRMLLATTCLDQAADAMQALHAVAEVAAMPETDRLVATLEKWWPAIEVLVVTGITNARTEAANTTIKHIKRTGRGFRNENNYRARIMLTSAAKTAA